MPTPSTQTGEAAPTGTAMTPNSVLRNTSPKFTPAVMEKAQQLRAEGMKWETIGKRLGVGAEGLKRRLDPAYRDRRNAQFRENREQRALGIRQQFRTDHLPAEQMHRLWSTIPTDTRGLTARVFGDPLPGRSALDQKRAAH